MRLKAAGKTDLGLNRRNNEDSLLVDDENGIFIIADGMGGHNAGEVASALAVQTVHDILKERLLDVRRTDSGQVIYAAEEEILKRILAEALLATHQAIRQKAATGPALSGMGTTLLVMIIRDGCAHICHSGDSRAYLFRENLQENHGENLRESTPNDLRNNLRENPHANLRQLTCDHTVGEYLVTTQDIPRDRVPPRQWHILTQALGTEEEPSPDFTTLALQHGDLLLICTDGLTDMLPDIEIESILNCHDKPLSTGGENSENEVVTLPRLPQPDNLGNLAECLVAAANARGGRDNISLILVRYD